MRRQPYKSIQNGLTVEGTPGNILTDTLTFTTSIYQRYSFFRPLYKKNFYLKKKSSNIVILAAYRVIPGNKECRIDEKTGKPT